MKFLAAITVISFICLSRTVSADKEDIIQFMKKINEDCQKELGTPDEVIGKFFTGEFDEGGADKSAMCHINCLMKSFAKSKDDNSEAFEKMMSVPDIKEAVESGKWEECFAETGGDECETGYKMFMCSKKNMKS